MRTSPYYGSLNSCPLSPHYHNGGRCSIVARISSLRSWHHRPKRSEIHSHDVPSPIPCHGRATFSPPFLGRSRITSLVKISRQALPRRGDVPHVPALLCNAPSGGRSRHPHRSGPPGCEHDDDLYPRPEPWPGGRAEPGGPYVPVMTQPALHCGATQDSKDAARGGIAVVLHDSPSQIWSIRLQGRRRYTAPRAAFIVLRGSR